MIQPQWKKSSNDVQGRANPSTHGLFIINSLHFVRKRESGCLKGSGDHFKTFANVFCRAVKAINHIQNKSLLLHIYIYIYMCSLACIYLKNTCNMYLYLYKCKYDININPFKDLGSVKIFKEVTYAHQTAFISLKIQ